MVPSDRDRVLAEAGVSRETAAALDLYVAQLTRWQAIKNLVGPATLPDVWTRHIADSLQLLDAAPQARTWLDLGSGAGIPGLILAIAGVRNRPDLRVDLVESNARKGAFLQETARLTGAPARIHVARIERVVAGFRGVDVVCARALAPLPQLIAWTAPLLKSGTIGLFPKGREAQSELTAAREKWTFVADVIPSRTDSSAGIVRISSLSDPLP
ncbi:methyltransferase GidB [Methylobacterium sp. 4-46]|uniref:Ribosomal RNA small subunit methyltransferase G n=1 Tax=Methylobacterium sp. (strain 4-46) TaxID=426117 RepID=RSMG_METS4|nr:MULTISPECIES: 16S rRNA (guanine(527)-N(7))-methyltransferase RsmG [Methylobacterium]B0UJI7.1 RecName: Full=Ribosomal RNA small subunit methyltransferase G; AltName: Full=16S rRNA 7-methylguanosine methyltransferase; Short=16S rRNA m7G methyltransferase [Methylobacterium sp. 4-46]ACA15925.1 methyltransferase GidB [Methylobacterium sp. 4-46]WFT81642.1 16S rRNA (guanine(527)-N(7))-methyltransferase RsmG [Methylobacterium nodulans]